MLSGCKCKEHILILKKQIVQIFNEHVEEFVIKEIESQVINEKLEELSIWDIM